MGATAAAGASVLPPLYARWMDDFLGAPIEPETHATCADCAMCRPADAPADPGASYFSPSVKCCTFLPVLRNFLVGRILLDAAPAMARGRASVEARIASGVALTPLGLGRPLTWRDDDGATGFGRDEALLCPHYVPDGVGTCGIWRHREAVCTTYFCKHVRGAVGEAFWNALHRLLQSVERALAWHCVESLDLGGAAVALLLGADGDGAHLTIVPRPDGTYAPDDRRAIWGRWAGRERAFFEAAARLVEPMSWTEILERGGPEVRLCARLARDAHARLGMPAVPAGPLHLNALVVTTLGPTSVRVATYSDTDPLDIPRELFDALARFDGCSAKEALRTIEAADGLEIEPDVVGHLVDFEVLLPGPAPAGDPPRSRPSDPES